MGSFKTFLTSAAVVLLLTTVHVINVDAGTLKAQIECTDDSDCLQGKFCDLSFEVCRPCYDCFTRRFRDPVPGTCSHSSDECLAFPCLKGYSSPNLTHGHENPLCQPIQHDTTVPTRLPEANVRLNTTKIEDQPVIKAAVTTVEPALTNPEIAGISIACLFIAAIAALIVYACRERLSCRKKYSPANSQDPIDLHEERIKQNARLQQQTMQK